MLTDKELKLLDKIQKRTVYEDKFFEKRSELKWFDELKRRGYFNPNPDTRPYESKEKGYFIIPQWNVLSYLERVSQQVNISGNEKYIDELLEIIRQVTGYHVKNDKALDNYHTWHYFVKILVNIPNEKITPDFIDSIPIWLDSKFSTMLQGAEITVKLLPKFLTDNPEDIKKAEKIIESITAIKTHPLGEERAKILGEKKETRLVIDSYWLKKGFDKYSEIIGEKCSKKVIEDLTNKIKSLLKKEEDGTYKSFYEEAEHITDDPLEMLTFTFRRILLAKAKSDVKTAEAILRNFLEDKYFYFPKMALFIIGQNMAYYSDLFLEILDTDICDFIMGNTLYLGDELKYVLKNLKNLTYQQKENLNKRIEQGTKRHTFKGDSERYFALYKQQIYHALSHDPYFKNLYEEMKKITNVDTELHPAIGRIETRWGPGPAPFSKEEIVKMSNDKLAEYLGTFKTRDFWKGPTVDGLADLLAEVAKEMPEKFIEDMTPFKDTGFIYIYEIFKGIKDAWNGRKIIDWAKLFKFIEVYIDRKEFWEDRFIVEKDEWLGGAHHEWVIGIIAEVVEEGTRDDSWAFSEDYFDKAKEIIFYLLREPKEDKEITDYVTYTLNTPCGKLISSLVNLALRIARVNDKKGIKTEPRWSEEYKNKFDEILEKKIVEAYTSLGRFLPNYYYLDKRWVVEKIEQVSTELGSKYWEAFMSGYLSIGSVYEDFYDLMRPNYRYGISYDFKERHDKEHLIQHICIGYLRGNEKLEDPGSLFRNIIDAWKSDQIEEIIGFFWMQRDYLREASEENEKIQKKIIEFWRQIYERYKGKDEKSLSHEDKVILSSASKLTALLPNIDAESYKWIMLSALYVSEDFNSSFFIEYLDEIKNKGDSKETAKYIGEIYLKLLEKVTPDFDQKHIRSIVECLYNAGAQENANKIRNIYGLRGHEFLRDIDEKYSASK